MKQLKEFITEKLRVNKDSISSKGKVKTKYHPKNKEELEKLIKKLLNERGENVDLNDIDVSQIDDMSGLFSYDKYDASSKNFNGDISNWDVSNVKWMQSMFSYSDFDGDISKWDVSNVEDMHKMFYKSKFNGDISNWDVSCVLDMTDIFNDCPLEKNPPKWYYE